MPKSKAKAPSKPKKKKATVIKEWSCEIIGNSIKVNQGDKINLTPYEYEILKGLKVVE
jgi:hypothetical protein|tara:strand:- start:515 stop:688 length:174 start_codon:yes stop_codon:yes gene_type:complete